MDFIYRDFPGKGDIRLYILDNTNLYIQIIGLCENNEDHTMRVNISVKNVDLYDIINTILDKITNDFLYINEYYNKTRFPYNDFIIIDEDEVSNNMACNYDKTKNSYGSSWMEFNKINFDRELKKLNLSYEPFQTNSIIGQVDENGFTYSLPPPPNK